MDFHREIMCSLTQEELRNFLKKMPCMLFIWPWAYRFYM